MEVTSVVLKVDLQCPHCYKKVKKMFCKYPEIRDQVYDEDENKITIRVVCCNPQKLVDKIRYKGGKAVQSIEIIEKKEPENPTEDQPEIEQKPEIVEEKPIEPEKPEPEEPEKKPAEEDPKPKAVLDPPPAEAVKENENEMLPWSGYPPVRISDPAAVYNGHNYRHCGNGGYRRCCHSCPYRRDSYVSDQNPSSCFIL